MSRTKKGVGQTALVTGASMGIGVDLAECFAKDGYDLILAARSESELNSVATRLAATFGVAATAIPVDLGRLGAGHALASEIAARGLGVDVVVNNAGYGIAGAFNGTDEAAQLGMVDLNIRALVELTHIYWPGMLTRRRGGVLNVASTAAFQPGPLMAVYFATKAYVLSFSEALAEELASRGVKVSVLCPGPVPSGFQERANLHGSPMLKSPAVLDAATVAAIGYEGLKSGKRVVIAGTLNKIGVQMLRLSPRNIVTKFARKIQEKKTS